MKNTRSFLSLSIMLSFVLICLTGSPDLMAGKKTRDSRQSQLKKDSRSRVKASEKKEVEKKEDSKKAQGDKSEKK